MDRSTWAVGFSEALRELRPHLSLKLAATVALTEYRADQDPKQAAFAYHQRKQPQAEPTATPAKKKQRAK